MKRRVLMGIAILLSATVVEAYDAPDQNGPTPHALQGTPAPHALQGDPATLIDASPRHGIPSSDTCQETPVTIDATPAHPEGPNGIFHQGTITDTLTLQEVTVRATFSDVSNAPLRLKTLDNETLKSRAAARTYPELLKGVPGLYATSESGSYGDAKLNIRGFRQENIAVLLNGIPISGLTSGNMFWNNWMGLADATYAIQLQKGIGSSMLTDGSVGGSVNILTGSTSEKFSGEAGVYASHYGTAKGYVSLNSGALPKGWGVNLLASYVGGKGYVDATDVSAFSYMLNVSKRIGEEHSLLFTALGSPEQHDQRSTRLSWDEVQQYGRTYNKNWGWRDGKAFNLSRNNYFKPYFTLQHIWNGEKFSMKNSVYLAIGNGGGRWTETKGKPISSFMKDGIVDWDAAVKANMTEDRPSLMTPAATSSIARSTRAGAPLPEGIAAKNILSDYMAGHTQTGAIASMEYAPTSRWTIGAGTHYQYYSTWERERITDLLGADYWYEDYENKSLAGEAGRNPYKKVGDFVRTDNGKVTHHGTLYATAAYQSEKLTANLGVSAFGSLNRRWDKYNYVGDIWSKTAKGLGASVKGGVLWKPASGHSLYVNGGWYSRLPYPSVWFSSGNNEITEGVRNEQNLLGELGYRFVWARGGVELTGYAAYWKNKTMMSNPYKQADAIGTTKYMVTGLDAFHCGVELDAFWNFTDWMKLSAYASIGDWRWKNDVQAVIYDDYSAVEVGRINVYSDGLPVGDAPQTQVGAQLDFDIPYGFRLWADWQFNDRMYADFDPITRTDASDRAASYRIPAYHLLGATLSWSKFFASSAAGSNGWRGVGLTIFAAGSNLLDTMYIERGKDGSAHDLATFRGYWGFGRNVSFGLRFRF